MDTCYKFHAFLSMENNKTIVYAMKMKPLLYPAFEFGLLGPMCWSTSNCSIGEMTTENYQELWLTFTHVNYE